MKYEVKVKIRLEQDETTLEFEDYDELTENDIFEIVKAWANSQIEYDHETRVY